MSCKSDSDKARLLLNQTRALIRDNKNDEAKDRLNEILRNFGHTSEATDANHILSGLKVQDEANRKSDETYRLAILTSLAALMLDIGRYPSTEEGLKALLANPGIPNWNGPYWKSDSASVLERFDYRPNGREEPYVALRSSSQKPR